MKKEYVLGFYTRSSDGSIALIRKLRPAWQNGLLNGIGGKLELNEDPLDAMVREFHEEAGVVVPWTHWRLFCVLEGGDWKVHCYAARGLAHIESRTDERVEWFARPSERFDILPNLRWLIPLMFDAAQPVASVVHP